VTDVLVAVGAGELDLGIAEARGAELVHVIAGDERAGDAAVPQPDHPDPNALRPDPLTAAVVVSVDDLASLEDPLDIAPGSTEHPGAATP